MNGRVNASNAITAEVGTTEASIRSNQIRLTFKSISSPSHLKLSQLVHLVLVEVLRCTSTFWKGAVRSRDPQVTEIATGSSDHWVQFNIDLPELIYLRPERLLDKKGKSAGGGLQYASQTVVDKIAKTVNRAALALLAQVFFRSNDWPSISPL